MCTRAPYRKFKIRSTHTFLFQATLSSLRIVCPDRRRNVGGISRTFGSSRPLSFIPFRRVFTNSSTSLARASRNGEHEAQNGHARGDRDAPKLSLSLSLYLEEGGGVALFLCVGSVHPSVRPLVRWYWPCNWAQTLSSARPAKDYTPACPEGPPSQTFLCDILCCGYLYLIHEVRSRRKRSKLFRSWRKARRCRERVSRSRRCNRPVVANNTSGNRRAREMKRLLGQFWGGIFSLSASSRLVDGD